MRITLEQFQTDFVTGLDSVVVGAQWLQQLLQTNTKLQHELTALQHTNAGLLSRNSQLREKIATLEAQDRQVYIVNTIV